MSRVCECYREGILVMDVIWRRLVVNVCAVCKFWV